MSMFEDFSNNSIKVSTKEELVQLLKEYDGILNNSMIDYFRSLIELEFSVVRNNISDSERLGISQLEIYKKAAIYNICNRALNIFKQNDKEFEIYGFDGLSVFVLLNNRSVKVFDFNYSNNFIKSMDEIGEINLYKSTENKDLREQELSRIQDELDKLYDDCNPYSYGLAGMDMQWYINEYQKSFCELYSRKFYLSDDDEREIEITKHFNDLLLEDYGLTNESFEEDFAKPDNKKTLLEKTLVKRMPNLVIKNNVKYI